MRNTGASGLGRRCCDVHEVSHENRPRSLGQESSLRLGHDGERQICGFTVGNGRKCSETIGKALRLKRSAFPIVSEHFLPFPTVKPQICRSPSWPSLKDDSWPKLRGRFS